MAWRYPAGVKPQGRHPHRTHPHLQHQQQRFPGRQGQHHHLPQHRWRPCHLPSATAAAGMRQGYLLQEGWRLFTVCSPVRQVLPRGVLAACLWPHKNYLLLLLLLLHDLPDIRRLELWCTRHLSCSPSFLLHSSPTQGTPHYSPALGARDSLSC